MEQHPAQPSTLADIDVKTYLDERVTSVIESFRYEVATSRLTKKRREYWRQHLAGPIGALETIRLALK